MTLEEAPRYEKQVPAPEVPLMERAARSAGNLSVRVLHPEGAQYLRWVRDHHETAVVPDGQAIVEFSGWGLKDHGAMQTFHSSLKTMIESRRELEEAAKAAEAIYPPGHPSAPPKG